MLGTHLTKSYITKNSQKIFDRVIQETRILCKIQDSFENLRVKTYGYTSKSFTGKSQNYILNQKLRRILQNEHGIHCDTAVVYLNNKSTNDQYNYTYLKLYNGELIIDMTYRSLLFSSKGPTQKSFSPYANLLFSFDPILLLDKNEIKSFYDGIRKHSYNDMYHCFDKFVLDIYKTDR